ncbi:hypothetical protein QMK19_35300 [Streptomyces sp. H10-C2]|uniref:hypothetical protein n=1 Tax=unclassified Streptomyces TaxID=2593676 RepID=UPI0024BAD37E|nr:MULTISPECIES: hypothetical protein [unclassified Streptomyces]MDJ0345902.1 hypothetical protein [Streptomyces sp. PH10-H1]MDJ0374751.1 hypothetical protein [Streptomyces sp. H10-C2]
MKRSTVPQRGWRRYLSARRWTVYLGVLVSLLGAVVLGPASTPAYAGPCDGIHGPAKDACENGGPDSGVGDITDCKTPPTPQRPNEGIFGYFASEPKTIPTPIDPADPKAPFHLYESYGFGGLTWHNYDTGCIGDAGAWGETNLANILFDIDKWWTGLTVELGKQATDSGYLNSLNPAFAEATHQVREAIYNPWIAVSLALLGSLLVFQARKKNLPSIMQAVAWALLVMTVTTFAFSYPTEAGRMADTAVTSTVGQIQQSVAGDSTKGSDPAVSQGNLLVGSTLYQAWLRGEFGSSDSAVAKKYGMAMFDAQALTWAESKLPSDQRNVVIKSKANAWKSLASKIHDEDPVAYGYVTGHSSGRLGEAGLAGLGALPANVFGIAASAVVLTSLLILRMLVVFLPAIAPLAIFQRSSGLVKTLGKSVAAALLNAPLFVLAGALDVVFVRVLLKPDSHIPNWFAVFILYILTIILWGMARPLRKMHSMMNPNANFLQNGTGGLTKTKAAIIGAGLGYAKGRLNAHHMKRYLGGGNRGNGGTQDAGGAPETETTTIWPGGEGADSGALEEGYQPPGRTADEDNWGAGYDWNQHNRDDESSDTPWWERREAPGDGPTAGADRDDWWQPPVPEAAHDSGDQVPNPPAAPPRPASSPHQGPAQNVPAARTSVGGTGSRNGGTPPPRPSRPQGTSPAEDHGITVERVAPSPAGSVNGAPERAALSSAASHSSGDSPQPASAPRVVESSRDSSGDDVFVIYSPSDGYSVTNAGQDGASTPENGDTGA